MRFPIDETLTRKGTLDRDSLGRFPALGRYLFSRSFSHLV